MKTIRVRHTYLNTGDGENVKTLCGEKIHIKAAAETLRHRYLACGSCVKAQAAADGGQQLTLTRGE